MTASRRDFLKVGLGGLPVISMAGTIPAFLSRFAFADASATRPSLSNDNILVVVQLSGGNDGLNCVIPYADNAYYKARPVIGIKDGFHKLDDHLALNPGMKAFKDLYDDGKLAVINGCGYPQPSRSHFRSMEIWQTAAPSTHESQGWLGHYIDHMLRGSDNPLKAVNIGSELPTALVADSAPVPSISAIEDFSGQVRAENTPLGVSEQKMIAQLNQVHDTSPALQFLSRQATNAIVSSEEIRRLTGGYKPDAIYPRNGLGGELRLIAQLINANFGTRLFYCEVGGFDTHSNQPEGHEHTLGGVATSIAAFHKDLAAKGVNDKVTVMCFSEFGRRVQQNNSNGTDHGAAGPMFVSGGKIKGGLWGEYPSLTQLDDGDLKYSTDFRRVYATVLDRWLNADSAAVLQNKFEAMDFISA